ncbi:MAG: CPBP family intramembrane metalloprotease [Gemmatimonadetes bacterium]|nr:CPBP family intramembrane metalloprotease [Gemmatimonadota bacterium]
MAGGREVLWTLFRCEIRMLLRDKRTIFIGVILPLFLFPAIILVTRAVEERERVSLESATYYYAVTGTQRDLAGTLVRDALTRRAATADTSQPALHIEESQVAEPDSALRTGGIHLVVEGMAPDEWRTVRDEEERARRERAVTSGRGDDSEAAPAADEADDVEVPVLRLHYRDNSQRSGAAMREVRDALRDLRGEQRERLFRERGFPLDPADVAALEANNLATREEEAGALIGILLAPLIVMMMLTGGSIVAADAIAGEKERGTLETLLTTAARRWEVVWAKQLSVVAVGVVVTLINMLNLLVYVMLGVFELPEDFAVSVTPATLVVLLLLYLPLALLVSSAQLLLSGVSKTYKEYQFNFFPVFLLLLIPAFAAVLPGIELRSAVVLVPVANVAVASREVLTGEFHWLALGAAFFVNVMASAYAARLTVGTLSTERLITAAELDRAELLGGPALFPRRVLTWFGVLWALLLVTSLWFGEHVGIRGQVTFNLGVLFFGGALLMMRRYRLDPRSTLALRAPPAAAWLAVLVGAPSGLVTGVGVARLAQLVFPVPEEVVESFGQYLLPDELPLWQIVFFLCVLPGICEEIAFRGVLLHGLRRRFHPVVLCLVVGAIFGFFHVSLFRLIPTAYVGVLLSAVVVLTGSIFPAMLWHALNNATALVPARLGLWEGEQLPEGVLPLGIAGLAVSFWILWRTRRLYPGLRE